MWMAVRSPAEIMEEMRRYYRARPGLRKSWRVLAGRDDHGFSDFFFCAPRLGIWQIKGEMRSPYELVGAGARLTARKVDDEIGRLMEGGMPVPFGMISPHPRFRDRAIVAAGLGSYQESMEGLRELIPPPAREVDLQLVRKLRKMRGEMGLDSAYL